MGVFNGYGIFLGLLAILALLAVACRDNILATGRVILPPRRCTPFGYAGIRFGSE